MFSERSGSLRPTEFWQNKDQGRTSTDHLVSSLASSSVTIVSIADDLTDVNIVVDVIVANVACVDVDVTKFCRIRVDKSFL